VVFFLSFLFGCPVNSCVQFRLITTDIAKFCDALAELYGNIGKPLLDIYLFSIALNRGLGASGMGTLWWAYFASAALLRLFTPNFGKMRAQEAKLEVG